MRNVFTIINDLAAGLAELKASLQPLAAFAGGSSTRAAQPTRRRRSRTHGRRRTVTGMVKAAASTKPLRLVSSKPRRAASPKLRAQRVQQGKYMGALRRLTAQQRAQVKKAKANGDYASALKLAASLQKKSA